MSIEQKLKQVPGVLWSEVTEEAGETRIDVVAHANIVNRLTQDVYVETVMKLLKDDIEASKLRVAVTKVRVEAGVDTIKKELEEMEGVIGVHVAPVEWDADRSVKKMGFVVNADETKFEAVIFQETFKRLVSANSVRVPLKVDFVLYRPKSTSILI